MTVDPSKIKLIDKHVDKDTATYRIGNFTFRVEREDWNALEKWGEIPDYVHIPDAELNKLFVYGIFLGENIRKSYGMSNPQYRTVSGYITIGDFIVQAIPIKSKEVQLTGLIVDVDPTQWEKIDKLEGNYDRIKVSTTSGETVWMYVSKGVKDE